MNPIVQIERRSQVRAIAPRLVRLQEVIRICGLSRTGVYAAIQAGTFPAPIKIGGRASAWIKHEVENWVYARIRASRQVNKVWKQADLFEQAPKKRSSQRRL
ncbi:MAG: helix-turn-helix transcriptional regulator [Telluria sp.]